MGVKRPLEEENLPELSFEQPKQLDSNKKLACMTEDFPDSPGEAKSDLRKLDSDGMLESGGTGGAFIADKELETSAPLSFVTSSSSSEEDVGNQDSSFCSNFRGYIDFNMPWRPPTKFDDPYIYLMSVPPRKQVRVGLDHQAEVPKWDPSASGKNFPGSNNIFDNEWEQKMMGTCISPFPGLTDSSIDEFTVGRGRADCSCEDSGSMRCVKQHVKEAREKLRDTIGEESFTKLGFYEMGEEVAFKWTGDDEQLFREVVISNPVSHGRHFWNHLSAVFPGRTKKELVSYYFNVYVLRRRGVQNRSYLLQIDSDNDEEQKVGCPDYSQNQPLPDEDAEDGDDLQHTHGDFHLIGGDEDTEVESFSDQDLDAGWVDDYGSEPENVCGNEGSDNNGGPADGNVPKKDARDEGSSDDHGTSDDSVPKQDVVEMDGETGHISGQQTKK